MGTLTIRKVPDEQIERIKEIASQENRSMESQVRSALEEWLAARTAKEVARKTNFALELRRMMTQEGCEGFDEEEFHIPSRDEQPDRPPVTFGES